MKTTPEDGILGQGSKNMKVRGTKLPTHVDSLIIERIKPSHEEEPSLRTFSKKGKHRC